MKDKQVITWSFISMFIFMMINFLMSTPIVKITDRNLASSDIWKSTIFVLILYLIPIILAVLNWKASFYFLGLVITMYSLGLLNVILTMATKSDASLLIKVLMDIFSAAAIVANAYWLVLALRLRKEQKEKRRVELVAQYQKEHEQETSKWKSM